MLQRSVLSKFTAVIASEGIFKQFFHLHMYQIRSHLNEQNTIPCKRGYCKHKCTLFHVWGIPSQTRMFSISGLLKLGAS